jgi:hypothetical protein
LKDPEVVTRTSSVWYVLDVLYDDMGPTAMFVPVEVKCVDQKLIVTLVWCNAPNVPFGKTAGGVGVSSQLQLFDPLECGSHIATALSVKDSQEWQSGTIGGLSLVVWPVLLLASL